jgi:signal transduction histidine kinase
LRANDQDTLLALASSTAGDLLPEGRVAVVAPPRGDVVGHTYAVPVEVRGAVVAELLADGKPSGIRRLHDAFDTVAAQLALAIERRQLRETERESARALAEQNERLLELDRMKDQFVSTVSHELRTPLTSMIGYLELLREGEAGELTQEQAHFLEIVDRNSHRLNDLIDDILFLSRVDGGRFSLDKKPVDLASLVREQVESISGAATTKGVELSLTVEEDPPPINADASRLVQLIDNLLSNAVKFTPEGGIVRVTVGARGGAAHLEVSDSGVGIPEDEVDRLFQRFFRASTAGTIKGTGLGLSIAKAIVDAHGGTISLRSEVGVGTTFMVDLPVGAAPEAETTVSRPTEVKA